MLPEHPSEKLLAELYERFARRDFAGVLAMCSDEITFTVPGHTLFSGVHTKADFQDWINQVWSISEGTFREVPRRIVANDRHGIVLLAHYLNRGGKELHYRTVHVWEIEKGLFTRWEEWPGDEAAFSDAWS